METKRTARTMVAVSSFTGMLLDTFHLFGLVVLTPLLLDTSLAGVLAIVFGRDSRTGGSRVGSRAGSRVGSMVGRREMRAGNRVARRVRGMRVGRKMD